jgi:integrase
VKQVGSGFGPDKRASLAISPLPFKHRKRPWNICDHKKVTPKSKAGHREVDVDPAVMTFVKKHIGDRQIGRVFQSKNGTPLVVNNVNRYVLKPICRTVKIPVGTTHAFRHGRVSVLQQNSVPGDLIKRWIGHTSLKTTSKYSHFTKEFRKGIASSLGKAS